MDSKLNKIETKIDTISSKMHSIDITLERNTASLEEHVRRTNILETKVEHVDSHVKMMNGALKLIGILALVAGLLKTLNLI